MKTLNLIGIALAVAASALPLIVPPAAHAEEGATLAALQFAYGREVANEHRYGAFARRAAEEGCVRPAVLFTALARAEEVSVRSIARALEGLGVTPADGNEAYTVAGTGANLENSITREAFDRRTAFPKLMDCARAECRYDELACMKYACDAAATHAMRLAEALSGIDEPAGSCTYYVCPDCGRVQSEITARHCDCGASTKGSYIFDVNTIAPALTPMIASR